MLFTLSGCQREEAANDNQLRFRENGEFVVLHIADLHECLNGRDILSAEHTDFITRLITEIAPDMVVFGGDNIFPLSTIGELLRQETLITIDAIGELMNGFEQPWTMVFGNHDDDAISDKKTQLLRAQASSPYFIGGLTDGDSYYAYHDEYEDMVGNYIIPVREYQGDRIAYNIIGLDSGSNRKNGYDYNFIKDSQIDWYKATSLSIKADNGGVLPPAIAFIHIPILEHRDYYEQMEDNSKVIQWVGNYGGYFLSEYSCNFLEACVSTGDVRGIFTGHNHYNSITMLCVTDNQNIMLSSTRQGGLYNNNDLYARVIVLEESGGFTTYEYKDTALNAISYR